PKLEVSPNASRPLANELSGILLSCPAPRSLDRGSSCRLSPAPLFPSLRLPLRRPFLPLSLRCASLTPLSTPEAGRAPTASFWSNDKGPCPSHCPDGRSPPEHRYRPPGRI